ncbi:MAG: hypothetical protein HY050_07855 [Actinobacteria bacterium]|nr:hypothetical protein [Actinomycetota bacterium]
MNSIKNVSTQMTVRHLKEPFRTSLRTVTHFDLIEFVIETADGLVAKGEAVETPAITGDTKERILRDLNGAIKDLLEGSSFASTLELTTALSQLPAVASAKAAADIALYNLQAAMEDRSLRSLLGCNEVSLSTDVTVPVADLAEIPQLIEKRIAEGFRSFKVKLAMESIDLSIEKLKLIRALVGDSSVIRIDPNQAWSLTHTLAFLERVESAGIVIEYLEQPTPAGQKAALAQIRRKSGIRIMADESCFTLLDLEELIDLEAVDLLNVKLLKSGGITPALEMVRVARQAGVEVLVGSMMEGDGGVYAAAALAGAIAPHHVHDLDASWWATDSRIDYSEGEIALSWIN